MFSTEFHSSKVNFNVITSLIILASDMNEQHFNIVYIPTHVMKFSSCNSEPDI